MPMGDAGEEGKGSSGNLPMIVLKFPWIESQRIAPLPDFIGEAQ